MPNTKRKREQEKEKIKESILKGRIRREFRKMGIDPSPEKIEKVFQRRKGTIRATNPVINYFSFYEDKVKPLAPHIKEIIDTAKNRQMKISVQDLSKRVGISGQPKSRIISSIEPAFLLEGISVTPKDNILRLTRTISTDKLSEPSEQFVNNIYNIDPQTDSPRISDFLNRFCKLI